LVFGGILAAGCGGSVSEIRPYGIQGYELYTGWIARSPYWPEDVPRLTSAQQGAFAETSWTEHEKVIEWVEAALDQD